MVNITRKKLKTKDYKLAQENFTQLLNSLTKKSAEFFVDELLSETERIMLTKRFAAVMMRSHNYSPYRISKILSISISTAQRIAEGHDLGYFDNLLSTINQKQKYGFLEVINDLIAAQASAKARARLMNKVLKA